MTAPETSARALIDDLKPHFHPSPAWEDELAAFYDDVFHNRTPRRLLCSLPGTPLPGHDQGRFDLAQQYHDPACMFYEHLRGMVAAARTGQGAARPSLRANLGTGFVASLFGVEQLIFPDKMPWPQGHLSKEAIAALEPAAFDDVAEKGLVPYARRIYDFYRAELGSDAWTFIPDTQGVLDIAHLVRGDELFLDIHEDAPFVHHLMECCLHAYVGVSKYLKTYLGEPLTSGKHGAMLIRHGGVRYCMDTSVLVSPALLEEFELPYLRRALQAFGGGWVHYCGYAPHLMKLLAEIPEVRAVNSAYMPEKPCDYAAAIALLHARGKAFLGAPVKLATESLDAYFDRVLAPLAAPRGLLCWPNGAGGTVAEMAAAWEQALARKFNA